MKCQSGIVKIGWSRPDRPHTKNDLMMKTKLKSGKTLCLLLLLGPGIFSFSQSYQDSLKKDDQDIVASIAPYPADVREAIINVSQYPQQIVKIERIQARATQSFKDTVTSNPLDEAHKYYEF